MDTEAEAAHFLADLDWCLAQASRDQRGALWKLAEPSRQLDANLIRLPPHVTVAPHAEHDVDVLLLAVAGSGTVHTGPGESGQSDAAPIVLTAHTLTWLPRGTRRSISAGPEGLAYLTVHRARPGMRIQLPVDPEGLARLERREELEEGGEAACLLPRICPTCGAVAAGTNLAFCPSCNSAWAG